MLLIVIASHEFTYIYSWNCDIRLSLAQNKVHKTLLFSSNFRKIDHRKPELGLYIYQKTFYQCAQSPAMPPSPWSFPGVLPFKKASSRVDVHDVAPPFLVGSW